jgi:hypothetical protein
MTPWYIHTLANIYAAGVTTSLNGGPKWVQVVGEPYTAGRLKAAWWVLTGRAYALRWPHPGELEAALTPRRPRPNPPSPSPEGTNE